MWNSFYGNINPDRKRSTTMNALAGKYVLKKISLNSYIRTKLRIILPRVCYFDNARNTSVLSDKLIALTDSKW